MTVKLRRSLQAGATAALFVLAALVAASAASAHHDHRKAHGVRAYVKRGTLSVKGTARADRVALRLKPGDPTVVQVDVGDDGSADFSFARRDVHVIDVKLGAGDDFFRVDDSNGAFTDSIPTTIDGGPGNDTLVGGQGAETYYGGPGDDTVIGGKGNDTAYLGNGDDTFVWNPGDGSDVIEGQQGRDTMLFNGANANENVTMSANGQRLRFFRDVGNVTMDTRGVEVVNFNALGGADRVSVGDLTATDVTNVNVDLAGVLGGSAGDGAVDSVTVNGTNGDDNVNVAGNGSGADITGLATTVSVVHADRSDVLLVNTLPGNDHVSVNGVLGMQLFVNGKPV